MRHHLIIGLNIGRFKKWNALLLKTPFYFDWWESLYIQQQLTWTPEVGLYALFHQLALHCEIVCWLGCYKNVCTMGISLIKWGLLFEGMEHYTDLRDSNLFYPGSTYLTFPKLKSILRFYCPDHSPWFGLMLVAAVAITSAFSDTARRTQSYDLRQGQ